MKTWTYTESEATAQEDLSPPNKENDTPLEVQENNATTEAVSEATAQEDQSPPDKDNDTAVEVQGNKETMWLTDFVAEKVSGVKVMSFGYTTLPGITSAEVIEELAARLLYAISGELGISSVVS